ncbi:MAG: hypothetical protein JOZ57_03445, partial [Abitibacteriaceae bacterium]|nr:hypothetical protein [Abditibacteriaceae bacterium]
VHDTDYFAKLPHLENRTEKYIMVPHNDGDTRNLWSAAGELSCLFGSETVPTRSLLTENGVAFDRVAKRYPGGVEALLNHETEAWGWRALVHTEPRPLIAADVKLRDIAPALRAQLEWGFTQSLNMVAGGSDETASSAAPHQSIKAQVLGWVDEYIQAELEGTLSDLYRWLTPRLWMMVRGEGSCNLQTGASLELFRFNRATANLPRFRFVDLFLQPATRDLARQCYDNAVRGSGIYTLGQLGAGALPFDVVIPGRGRGTLRLHDGSLYIDTEEPITLCTGCDCGSVEELADVLEAKFGERVALVGKAVALISMLAHEFIFVFHEKASSYTNRTQAMNQALRAAGVDLKLYPMLRLKYATWDALGNATATLRLPPHLAVGFGKEIVPAAEFGARWQSVCEEQDKLRAALKASQSPRDLLAILAEWRGGEWIEEQKVYAEARQIIKTLRQRTLVLEQEVAELREQAKAAKQRAGEVERAKGEDFRATIQPLRERIFDIKEAAAQRLVATDANGKPLKLTKEERAVQAQRDEQESQEVEELRARITQREKERAHFDEEIRAPRALAHNAQVTAKAKIAERIALERSADAVAARATIARIEYEAELARLRYTRDSIAVSYGLRYTNYRPTAWWFPLVSPDGKWFDQLVQTAEIRIEEL